MSIKAIALVQERTRAKGSNLLALLAIADHAHDDGTHGFPSPATIAWKSRLTERAVEIILRKLVRDGEVAPEWDPAAKRLYLHLRCIAAWGAYQTEGPIPIREKIPRRAYAMRESFARSLVATAAAIREDPCDIRERRCHIRERRPVENRASLTPVTPCASQPSGSVNDPSVQKVQGLTPHFLFDPNPKTPEACLGLITRLVHDTFDLVGVPHDGERVDFADLVKDRCAELHIPYTATVVGQAIESALVQRARARRPEGMHAAR